MGSSVSSSRETLAKSQQSIDEYVDLEHEQILKNQLLVYINCLTQVQYKLSLSEESFIPVAQSSIINIMGKKQCESYLKFKAFTSTEFDIMRSIHKLPHFNVDKRLEVKRLTDPLQNAFKSGSLKQVRNDILSMKKIQEHQGYSLTTIDYQLLDIMEYITRVCLNVDNETPNALTHWLNIFDILFRGTNIKITRNERRPPSDENKQSACIEISFQILSRDRFPVASNSTYTADSHKYTKISSCFVTSQLPNESTPENDENESLDQSESIILNKEILDAFQSNDASESGQNIYPIGIHLIEYTGYVYSIRRYKGVYIASQVCETTLFVPQTINEFQSFLFQDNVLEVLCNIKRHYVNIAKYIRRTSSFKSK